MIFLITSALIELSAAAPAASATFDKSGAYSISVDSAVWCGSPLTFTSTIYFGYMVGFGNTTVEVGGRGIVAVPEMKEGQRRGYAEWI